MAPTVVANPVPVPTTQPQAPTLSPSDVENTGVNRTGSGHPNKIKHRSSRPILAWVQKKLADATGKTGRDQILAAAAAAESPVTGQVEATGAADQTVKVHGSQQRRVNQRSGTHPAKRSGHQDRTPQSTVNGKDQSMRKKAVRNQQHAPINVASGASTHTRTTSASHGVHPSSQDSDPPSPRSTSLSMAAPGSTWSNLPEADDDASIRPLPPTSPPSPAPSRSTHHTISSCTSGGYLSDPKTARSGAASTKPTTLLSIDVAPAGPVGHAHIAQAPPSISGSASMAGPGTAPSSPSLGRFPSNSRHVPQLSGQGVTFSSTGRHPLASTQIPSEELDAAINAEVDGEDGENILTQAPNMSHYHPRNNPRPASPPLDNASTLTLASSTFALSPRHHPGTPSLASRFPNSLLGGGHRPSSSITALGLEGYYDGDADASVRALRPRSRRGSWNSVTSTETGWSAAVHALGPSTRKPAPGPGSMRTTEDPEADEEQSIRHIQIDEEDTPGSPVGGEDGEKVADKVEQTPHPPTQPLVPITLTVPTPNESGAATPAEELVKPLEIEQAVDEKATEKLAEDTKGVDSVEPKTEPTADPKVEVAAANVEK